MSLGSWVHHGDLELARDNEMKLLRFRWGRTRTHISLELWDSTCVYLHPAVCVVMLSRMYKKYMLFNARAVGLERGGSVNNRAWPARIMT